MIPTEKQAQILIKEDDPHLLKAAVRLLEKNHYAVFSADSGARGLDLVREIKPDLVLLDVVHMLEDDRLIVGGKDDS